MSHAAESTQAPDAPRAHAAVVRPWTPAQFGAALDAHWRTLWSIAAAVMNDRVGADDAVQDAAIIAMDKLASFDPATNFVAWMGSIVRYTALNHARRNARDSGRACIQDADPAARTRDSDGPIEDPRLGAALDVLEPIARACIVLRTTAGLSYREIATALEIPEGTAMSHVHRSRATLRHLLSPATSQTRGGHP